MTSADMITAIAAGLPAGPFSGAPFMLKDLGAPYERARRRT